ncbi:MFS general substrate transporter [Laetiporus sulphureus 93-53]|uniref:MFS general substrate transporter n=1 Tax=Laetiporus sulphureus 93-53 TaxID=1314785 RepID=A0A165DYM2_9APHY|nr:MFS general substrate transporter [Laetiporus sulphureus 93-53]KZT05894.1 MFS general substrate transporter [Laetiporus sulphureus 93-53]
MSCTFLNASSSVHPSPLCPSADMSTALRNIGLRAIHRANSVSSDDKEKLSAVVSTVQGLPLGAPAEQRPRNYFWRRSKRDLDSTATQPSVFDDPATLELYRPPAAYENAHRFDPLARWTWREEYRLVRKIDLLIMSWAFIMFFGLQIDRGNISQANTDNFLEDLNMTTDDFDLGNTLNLLCFLSAELPSQLVSKRVGPDVWIPSQLVLWSIVSLSQFWLSGRGSFLATRCLLGLMQGGFIPDMILYLSYFYTRSELTIRLAWFWVSNSVAQIVCAFLAVGILRLDGTNGRAGWRYLFLIEGGFTCLVGIIAFFMMPPSPTQTKAWHRPNGWFTEREEVIMVNRVLRDDPSKSEMHNREGLTPKKIYGVLKDWRMWPIYILGLVCLIPVTPPQTYLTLVLRDIGFDTTQSNLLSIPSTVLGIIMMCLSCYFSEMVDSRALACLVMQIWALPLLIALETFTARTSPWVWFTVVTLVTGYPDIHPVQVAWASANSYSVGTRTVSASLYNMFVQADGIVSAYIYRSSDSPLYRRGNKDLIAIAVMNIVLYVLTHYFYRTINHRREKKWNSMTAEEQEKYLETTTDKGNEMLNFRFVY